MKKGFIAIAIAVIIGIGGVTIWNQRCTAVKLQNKINAQYTSNQNAYDNMWKEFCESTQVTELQAEQMKNTYLELTQARYEKDDSLMMKAIQEDNPDLDSSVYVELQKTIKEGRTMFKHQQDVITDIVNEYNNYVDVHPLVGLLGYEHKNTDDFIVTSIDTQKAFESKQADAIKLK